MLGLSRRDIFTAITFVLALSSLVVNFNTQNQLAQHYSASSAEVSKRFVEQVPASQEDISVLKNVVNTLAQTMILQQTAEEQRVRVEATNTRSVGNSGVTDVRSTVTGTQAYHQTLHWNGGVLSIHDHSNYDNLVGMGEFSAVLNGIQFWTRHNDYRLRQPVNDSKKYHSSKDIEFPAVPPSVLAKATVVDQIEEMRQYFKAWSTQNSTIRDYKPYFKPVLCYLEGSWMNHQANIVDGFASDRHQINAATFEALNAKTQFHFAAGTKDTAENLPFLPSALRGLYTAEDYNYIIQAGAPNKPLVFFESAEYVVKDAATKTPMLAGTATVSLTKTSQGLYIAVVHGALGTGTAGTATIKFTCTGTGCSAISNKAPYCSKNTKSCTAFTAGTGTVPFSWAAAEAGMIVYGPLSDCTEVAITWDAALVTGLAGGIRLVIDDSLQNFTSRTFTDPSPLIISGCSKFPLPIQTDWSYRIMCHPLNRDLPLNRLRLVDDLAMQMSTLPPKTLDQLKDTRNALFQLNSQDKDKYYDTPGYFQFIDQLMYQIPGKDNYDGNLTDTVTGAAALQYASTKTLNTAYYSRYFTIPAKDAMGRSNQRRGFNDNTLWAAMTTYPQVNELVFSGSAGKVKQRWTYAIPLEIIYLTPLQSWNPYNFTFFGRGSPNSKIPTMNGRDGKNTTASAFNGTSYEVFYRTPVEFFSGTTEGDAADTSTDAVSVLDQNGVVRNVRASGVYIHLPKIAGVDAKVRIRYPICPVHSGKSLGYLQTKALQHMMQSGTALWPDNYLNVDEPPVSLFLSPATTTGQHVHPVEIASSDLDTFREGATQVVVNAQQASGHTHTLTVGRKKVGDLYAYFIIDCDGAGPVCFDGHDHLCTSYDSCGAAPQPTPQPAPVPAPQPGTQPAPQPGTQPAPQPQTEPGMQPQPEPGVPQPGTQPEPKPAPQPDASSLRAQVVESLQDRLETLKRTIEAVFSGVKVENATIDDDRARFPPDQFAVTILANNTEETIDLDTATLCDAIVEHIKQEMIDSELKCDATQIAKRAVATYEAVVTVSEPESASTDEEGLSVSAGIGISVGVMSGLILILAAFFYYKREKKTDYV